MDESFVGERGREQGEGAYDWRCRFELLRRRVLNLESANLEEHERSRYGPTQVMTHGVLEK